MDHDLGRDVNALGGFPDTPVHQVPRSSQAYRFRIRLRQKMFQRRDSRTGQAAQF